MGVCFDLSSKFSLVIFTCQPSLRIWQVFVFNSFQSSASIQSHIVYSLSSLHSSRLHSPEDIHSPWLLIRKRLLPNQNKHQKPRHLALPRSIHPPHLQFEDELTLGEVFLILSYQRPVPLLRKKMTTMKRKKPLRLQSLRRNFDDLKHPSTNSSNNSMLPSNRPITTSAP